MPAQPETDVQPKLLRIQEVAAQLGLTARSIRYYEEMGLLEPAGRSDGDYRLYDSDNLDRLRFIKGLRDDAGFSLAEIAQLLEDETVRARNRTRFGQTHDPAERRAILQDALVRIARQVDILRAKTDRLEAMIGEANTRRVHLTEHLAELEAEVAGDRETAAAHARAAHAAAATGDRRTDG
ncbi:MAG: MerR family transcriptional regulator [Chloroflexota bacterium]